MRRSSDQTLLTILDRRDQAPARGELLAERRRDGAAGGRGDVDRVERCVLGQPAAPSPTTSVTFSTPVAPGCSAASADSSAWPSML